MPSLNLKFTRANEPPAFTVPQERILDPVGAVEVGLREGATEGGNPTVTMVIPLAGGMFAVVETTWRLWLAATVGMQGAIQRWEENPQ